jgi:hypothetical protein
MRRVRIAGIATAGIIVLGLIGAVPATAGVADRGTYVDNYTDHFDACGTSVDVSGTVSGRFIDQLRGSDPSPYHFEHFVDRTTYTNVATHRSFSTVAQTTHLDTGVVPLGGNLIAASGKDAGTFSVYDSAGNLYYRLAGLQRGTFVIDTMGTPDPSDDQIVSAQSTDHGHFPASDFCADLLTLTA